MTKEEEQMPTSKVKTDKALEESKESFRQVHLRMARESEVENIFPPYSYNENGGVFGHNKDTPIGRRAEELLFRMDSSVAELEALKAKVRIAQNECSLCDVYLSEYDIYTGREWDECECVSSLL